MHRRRVVLVLQLSHVLLRRLEFLVLQRDTTLQNLVLPRPGGLKALNASSQIGFLGAWSLWVICMKSLTIYLSWFYFYLWEMVARIWILLSRAPGEA